MKKYIAFILITAMLLSLFVGCTNNEKEKEYTTAIIGSSCSSDMSGLKKEYEIRDYEGFEGKKGPENVTFNHKGEKITVSLSEIEGEFLRDNYYPVYRYQDIAWFNPNGDLERYNWGRSSLSEVKRKCSEEEAIRVATEFVSEFINLDHYKVSVKDFEDGNRYFVFFTKYVDGIKTTEELEVTVNYHGELHSYVADMLNQFPEDTKNPFDMDEVEKTVHERVNSIVSSYKEDYDSLEYDEEFRLTKLKDGSLAIEYTVEIVFQKNLGDEIDCSGGVIEMLVMQ